MMRVWLAALVVAALVAGRAEVRAESVDAWSATAMLEGQWRQVRGTEVADEIWMNNKGNVIVGMRRRVDGLWNSLEFLRIENRKEGIVFLAQPDGNKMIAFRLTAHDANKLVFTNPAHDFPQRIEYRRTGPDTLEATVGMLDGKGQKLAFKYTRVK
jgi:hypothetical protein